RPLRPFPIAPTPGAGGNASGRGPGDFSPHTPRLHVVYTGRATAAREAPEMNLKDVNATLTEIEDGLMGGLATIDVFSKSSGMSVAGIRSSPKACALFNILCER